MSRKRWLALIAFAMLLVVSSAINFASFSSSGAWTEVDSLLSGDWNAELVEYGTADGSIAILDVDGVIQDTGGGGLFDAAGYNHQQFISQIDHAMSDPQVQGIILRVNTPGGGVVESAEIYDKIVEAKENFGKSVYVSMGSMAASGGYYISAPADRIIASPHTITGSIGVIMESINIAELAENFGVKVETIKSGPYKDIMSSTRDMTSEEREILQSLIDESYDEFVRIIAEGRQIDEEEVRQIADGRIYSGNQALNLNLVDELGSLEDTISWMKEELGDLSVVRYQMSNSLSNLWSMSMQRIFSSEKQELNRIQEYISKHRAPTLKYIYAE